MLKDKNRIKVISEQQSTYLLGFVEAPVIARPFLKWAGGKGQLLNKLISLLPTEIHSGKIKKYAEPFIGGGALFFYVAQNYPNIKDFFISDINPELILAYKTIQKDVESLIASLEMLEANYHLLSNAKQKEFFYNQRDSFNKSINTVDLKKFQKEWIERTTTLIFLNRTCFNGLFRVNSKGEFNVPFGKYKNPRICDADNLRSISILLQNTQIELGDFSASKKFIDSSTFVYFDPPYRPLSKTSVFTSYSKFSFGDEEQKKLAEYFYSLSKRKARLMLSNSDPKNENLEDKFFEDLYQEFNIERVDATRMINSKSNGRGKIKELVIMNY